MPKTEETKEFLAIIYTNIGICYNSLSQFSLALASLNKAIELNPSYQKAYYRKVLALKGMKHL